MSSGAVRMGFLLAAVLVAGCATATELVSPSAVPPPTLAALPTLVASPTSPPPTATPMTANVAPHTPSPEPTDAPAMPTIPAPTTTPAVIGPARMNLQVGDRVLVATLADNSSADALIEALAASPITLDMRDYANMEKVGPLGMALPTNDESITTKAGDLILDQGSAFVIYYAPNSWTFTRLGEIDDVNEDALREILGDGNVTVTLSLPEE